MYCSRQELELFVTWELMLFVLFSAGVDAPCTVLAGFNAPCIVYVSEVDVSCIVYIWSAPCIVYSRS